MNLPGPIAKRAVQDALANVGVHEQGGNNQGQYVEVYQRSVGLKPGDPWCAAFASYRIRTAAVELQLTTTVPKNFPASGYCPDYKEWAINNGVWIPCNVTLHMQDIVNLGDLCLFYFPAKQRVAHIGFVVDVNDWGCHTVEGNTGPEAGEEVVNREGDGVYKKTRNWEEFGGLRGGFVRLPF